MSIISSVLESQSNPRSSAIFLVTSVMENQLVRQRLMEAAEARNISLLTDEIPFVDTPFYIAASAGHAHFALEMMRLMPSFGKKLNPQGLSPLDLALQRREGLSPSDPTLQNRITSTIRRLIYFDKELIRVKEGKASLLCTT
ncbi:hypothetical protein ACSBR1_038332 [Camellia fascicularis]